MQKFDSHRTTLAAGLSGTNFKRWAKKVNNRKARRAAKNIEGETLVVRKTLGMEVW